MSIIDKIGERPTEVTENDNGDIIYHYWKDRFRYAVDGVYVSVDNGDDEPISNGFECRVDQDDSIEHFQWAKSWAMIASAGDEPLYELGRHLTEVGGDMTPSGWGYNPEKTDGMKLWFEIPEVWVMFQMEDDGFIRMEDCFTGDTYISQTVEGALDRLTWLIQRTAERQLLDDIEEAKEKTLARFEAMFAPDEEDEDENAN